MKTNKLMVGLAVLMLGFYSSAQTARLAVQDGEIAVNSPGETLPRIVKFSGAVRKDDGSPATGAMNITFSVYESQQSTSPLWSETQPVTVDASGKYNVLLGSMAGTGIPQEIFAKGDARWLGVQVEGKPELERTIMVSVPYALKSGDADKVAGHAFTDFLMTRKAIEALKSSSPDQSSAAALEVSGAVSSSTNTVNKIAKFSGVDTVGNSAIFENNGLVGIGNVAPAFELDVTNADASSLGANLMRIQSPSTFGSRINFQSTSANGRNWAFGSNFIVGAGEFGIYDYTANQNRFYIDATGRVGINTIPGFTLDVRNADTTPTGANVMQIRTPSVDGARINFVSDSANGRNYAFGSNFILGNGEFGIYDYTANTSRFFITSAGNIGIGTISPTVPLQVAGNNSTQVLKAVQSGAGAGSFSVSSLPPTGVRGEVTATSGVVAGVTGISSSPSGYGVVGGNNANSGTSIGLFGVSALSTTGTAVWGDALATTGDAVGVFGRSTSSSGTGVFGIADTPSGDAAGVFGRSLAAGGTGVWGEVTNASGTNFGVYGRIASAAGGAGVFDTAGAGNILIGRAGATPVNVFRVDSTGKVFANGGSVTSGADFAESVTVSEEKFHYQPGDVIAIDSGHTRTFMLASKPYSTLVAGIYSTKPGVLATPHTADDPRIASEEIPLAVVGIVPCKVSSENGEVRAGDLLVASSTPGYAMKGTDRNRLTGAVIGKALQSMNGRTGVIEVLVSLQ